MITLDHALVPLGRLLAYLFLPVGALARLCWFGVELGWLWADNKIVAEVTIQPGPAPVADDRS